MVRFSSSTDFTKAKPNARCAKCTAPLCEALGEIGLVDRTGLRDSIAVRMGRVRRRNMVPVLGVGDDHGRQFERVAAAIAQRARADLRGFTAFAARRRLHDRVAMHNAVNAVMDLKWGAGAEFCCIQDARQSLGRDGHARAHERTANRVQPNPSFLIVPARGHLGEANRFQTASFGREVGGILQNQNRLVHGCNTCLRLWKMPGGITSS